jgi:2-iminobutanoate/2-iminopropanoate deaminase
MAGFAITVLSGCGNMPTLSSSASNWPQSGNMTAEETRAMREAEVARYRTASQDNKMTALASNAANLGLGAGSASAPGPEVPASSRRAESTARQAPAVRETPKRDMVASAAVSTSGVPQASRYGDLVFLSGLRPLDTRGQPLAADVRMEDQARLALDNVRSVLETNRLTMANIVSMTVYLRDLNDMRAFDAVYAAYFKGAQPARTVVEVSKLPNNARIEISAVAGR